MLLHQAVVEGLKRSMANQCEGNWWESRQFSLERALINFNDRDGSITFLIIGAGESRGKGDKAFSLQGEQELSTGHILEATVWLTPIPLVAEDLGDVLTSYIPVPVNNSLNQIKIGFVNGFFSDGNGQHSHCISERKQGRQ